MNRYQLRCGTYAIIHLTSSYPKELVWRHSMAQPFPLSYDNLLAFQYFVYSHVEQISALNLMLRVCYKTLWGHSLEGVEPAVQLNRQAKG